MRILNWYVTKSFLATFLMAIGILTFGLAGAQLIKIFSYMAQGIPASVAFKAILYFIPHALCFTVPWASLVSIMLVFGRLSADNEITAMRSCGVSILQIVAPLIVTTMIFTAICLQLQFETGPKAMEKSRNLAQNVVLDHPLALFVPGIPIDLDQFVRGTSLSSSALGNIKTTLYCSSRDENDYIYDVQVYQLSENGIETDVTASKGKIEADKETKILKIVLYNAQVEMEDGGKGAYAETFDLEFDYGKKMDEGRLSMRPKFLTVKELLARSVILKREGSDTTQLEVELSMRVCLALAPIAFLLLGMPLAIQTNRRETSVGLFLSVLLAGIYFANVLAADALSSEKNYYPQYLIWIVPFLYQAFGAYYIIRIARR